MTLQEHDELVMKALDDVGIKLSSDKEFARQFFIDAGIVFPEKMKKSKKAKQKKSCRIISLSR